MIKNEFGLFIQSNMTTYIVVIFGIIMVLCAISEGRVNDCECTIKAYEDFFVQKPARFVRFIAYEYIDENDQRSIFCHSGNNGKKRIISQVTFDKEISLMLLETEFIRWSQSDGWAPMLC